MKKFMCLCCGVIMTLCIGLLGGCKLFGKHLDTENYGAITWVTTKSDEGTRIYANGELLEEFTDNVTDSYIMRLEKGNYEIEIKGYKGDKEMKTAKFEYSVPSLTEKKYTSAEEFIADQDDEDQYFFYDAQHLILDYRNSSLSSDSFRRRINIANNVKKVSILSDKRIDVRASFIILKRNEDITFELENVNLKGFSNSEYVIDYDGVAAESADGSKLIIKAFGSVNTISSDFSASDGETGEEGSGIVHATSGKSGGNGGGAIRADKLVIISENDIAFSGSDGGDGGNGGNGGMITVSGNGGSGGRGGNAINCDTCELFMRSGRITAVGGKGGLGGRGGSGGIRGGGNGSDGSAGVGVNANTKTALHGSFEDGSDEK